MDNHRNALLQSVTEFLTAACRKLSDRYAHGLPKTNVRSSWIAVTDSGVSSEEATKVSVDISAVIWALQEDEGLNDWPEYQSLYKCLGEAGAPVVAKPHDYALPLIRRVVPCSGDLNEEIDRLGKRVVQAIETGRTASTELIAIEGLRLPNDERLNLDNGLTLRPIGQDELLKFGQDQPANLPAFQRWIDSRGPNLVPRDSWLVFEAVYDSELNQVAEPGSKSDAFLAALALSVEAEFAAEVLQRETEFGIGSAVVNRSSRHRVPSISSSLDMRLQSVEDPGLERLEKNWTRLRSVLDRDLRHPLLVPALRFCDGLTRDRGEDAVVDYAIALESMLTPPNSQGELAFRFALNGALILGGSPETRQEYRRQLNAFYTRRSVIVHGGSERKGAMPEAEAAKFGQETVRTIWWWFFEQACDSEEDMRDALESLIFS